MCHPLSQKKYKKKTLQTPSKTANGGLNFKKNHKEKNPPSTTRNAVPGGFNSNQREEQIIGTQDEAQKLVAQRLLVILHCLDSTNSS